MDQYLVRADGTARPIPKSVFCVRHGESEANVRKYLSDGIDKDDALYFDSPLTPVGCQQARGIRAEVAKLKPELVIVSPMTRAIQTCLAAMGDDSKVPVLVEQLCSEMVCCAADIGSPRSALERKFGGGLLWGDLQEHWWWANGREDCDQLSTQRVLIDVKRESHETLIQRANAFKEILAARPEKRIVVFSHSGFLAALFGDLGSARWMANCEIRTFFV